MRRERGGGGQMAQSITFTCAARLMYVHRSTAAKEWEEAGRRGGGGGKVRSSEEPLVFRAFWVEFQSTFRHGKKFIFHAGDEH